MSWWFAGTMAANEIRKGQLASKRGDREGDRLNALAGEIEQAAARDVRNLKKNSYSNNLVMKATAGDAIEQSRTEAVVGRESVKASQAGSGATIESGSALDVRTALINNSRLDEANIQAVNDINIARNDYETNMESERITREAKAEADRMRQGASAARQAGRDAKLEHNISAGIKLIGAGVEAGYGSKFNKWLSGGSAVAGEVRGGRGGHTAATDTRGRSKVGSKGHSYEGRTMDKGGRREIGYYEKGRRVNNPTDKIRDSKSPVNIYDKRNQFTTGAELTRDLNQAFTGKAEMSQINKWRNTPNYHQRLGNKIRKDLNLKLPSGIKKSKLKFSTTRKRSGYTVTDPSKAYWSKTGESFLRPRN